ncbi:hypothetical protein ACSNOI_42030 [Actinomadura kijaniata]|uniref:hypothetical protein n=1 Tax=Actinomadura kijaniata TaxID=46161 RepID=UPI003F1C7792
MSAERVPLDRAHEFAVRTGRGTYRQIRYDEAVVLHRRGEQLYRRILPGHALTRAEKRALAWEPVPPTVPTVPADASGQERP